MERINISGEYVTRLMSTMFSKIEEGEIEGVVSRLASVNPSSAAASERFDYQMRGVGCITDKTVLNPEFIGKSVGEVRAMLVVALDQDVALLAIEKEYAFDVQLAAALRVRAKSQAEAESLIRRMLDAASCNAGCWPSGDPILFEASVAGPLSLFEVNGQSVSECLVSREKENWAKSNGITFKREFGDKGEYLWRSELNNTCWIGYYPSQSAALDEAIACNGTFEGAIARKSALNPSRNGACHNTTKASA
jgi:hypothetical protein